MANARQRVRQRRRAKSLIGSMRNFLTPEVFKQVRNASKRRKSPRWDLHPSLWILLLTTYCCGDSLPEKFEVAKGFYVACCPKRKRPGKSFAGFEKAVGKLPMPVLRALAAGVRGRFQAIFQDRWMVGSFIPFGCDGTRQNCPRSEELERRLGSGGKKGSSPTIWNTSIVHLTLAIPFCWRLGRGSKPSERSHLISMLALLPAAALIVADAGYVGYEVIAAMMTQTFFLIRMSSMATFYTESNEPLDQFCEGIVYYWPKNQQKEEKPPLRGRLMKIHSARHKKDVWLFTNVEDTQRLSLEMAAICYRWRWENEGFFRTYKRTLKKATLMSRTVAQIHREAEASMIATQLLLCQGAMAMPTVGKNGLPVMCSPRRVLLEARRDISARKEPAEAFAERITRAERERRERTSAKEKREWPRRKPHTAPHPPILLRLTDEQKLKVRNQLQAA
jgi:cation transport regulator ChaC